MTFWIESGHDSPIRLKSFTATSGAARHTIRIVLETTDTYEFGYAMQRLADVQKGQRTKPKPEPKQKAIKPLGLPAPMRTLPKPEGHE